MATLSFRLQDELKQKITQRAHEQGVSVTRFVNATLAATIAQQETLEAFDRRLRTVDQQSLHQRVLQLMSCTESGPEPTDADVTRARG